MTPLSQTPWTPIHINRSTDDTISTVLHTPLSHPDRRGNNCENVVHRLQLIIQYNRPLLAQDPGNKHFPLQLDPGLLDGLTPGYEG
jgi:hypothetical protein